MFVNASSSERRKYTRARFAEPVAFEFKDVVQNSASLSCDLSEGGIRLNVNDFVTPGTEMTIHLRLPDGYVVDCPGKVAWTEKLPHCDRYQIGLEFSPVDSFVSSRHRIQQHIDL